MIPYVYPFVASLPPLRVVVRFDPGIGNCKRSVEAVGVSASAADNPAFSHHITCLLVLYLTWLPLHCHYL